MIGDLESVDDILGIEIRTQTIGRRKNKQQIMFLRKEREKIRHAIIIYQFRVEIYIFPYYVENHHRKI
jgi:hypothetical protein